MPGGDLRFFDEVAPRYDAHWIQRFAQPLHARMLAALEMPCAVLDVGCGTGTFACRLALRGLDVVGVDPAAASLAVARTKPGAAGVRWLHGDATMLPPLQVDLAIMTGNVAQVFITDDEWLATLRGVRAALKPGGRLVFETRDPAARGWLPWDGRRARIPGVARTCALTEVREGLVSFRYTYTFDDGAVLTSDSTLRFRSRSEVEASLLSAGFTVDGVRGAPDRPGLEFVFLTRRTE